MPGWPGGLGNRLQDLRTLIDQGLGDRLQAVQEHRAALERGRIAQAFGAASEGQQEPSEELYAAKHRRAQGPQPQEPGFWSDLMSSGPAIRGTLKAMTDPRTSPFSPAAVARMFFDPVGEAGYQVETGEQLAAPFTQFNDPNVDPVKQGADLALTVMGGSSVVPAEANSLRMGIKAYHASPHDFERFDASKIGTGQGAQSFGHGIYVAENPRVSGRGGRYDREFTAKKLGQSDTTPQQEYILNRLDEGASDLDILKGMAEQGGTDFEQAQGMLDKVKANRAKIYEVDIAADPEHFLDWDKPLSEQSPKVATPDILEAVRQEANSRAMSATHQDRRDQLFGMVKDPMKAPGEFVVEVMAPRGRGGTRPQELSQKLKDMGIPGIKYLDQGSRGKGSVVAADGKPTGYHNIDQELVNVHGGSWEAFKAAHPNPPPQLKAAIDELDARGGVKFNREAGTSNFVVFPGNEHLISILKKYGLPISAAGLAALSQLHPQEAQAQPLGDRLQRGK